MSDGQRRALLAALAAGGDEAAATFYERYLAANDPGTRAARGVYVTPIPLVRFVVRSVDVLLRRDFGHVRGFADPRVHVLDPATGTGIFLRGVVDHEPELAKTALAPRLHGRELLAAPFAAARVALGAAADIRRGDALTLELDSRRASPVPEGATLVVLGNPPFRGDAPPRGGAIDRLLEDYKRGVRDEERQIQRLSNDYVRFFRLAQELVERAGRGIIAFVSDAGYTDGVLFRGMRAELLRASFAAYVLALGGGARRGPSVGGAAKDENVFAITQPVAMSMFVLDARRVAEPAAVHVARLEGSRAEKLAALDANDVSSIAWERVRPSAPAFLFRAPLVGAPYDAYATWPSLLDVAGTGEPAKDRDHRYGTGVKTRHDAFAVAFTPDEAVAKVKELARRREPDDVLVRALGLCTTAHFDVAAARARAKSGDLHAHVRPLAYRPFDTRYVVYLRDFVCEPKVRTMKHLTGVRGNVALAALRRDRRGLATGYFAGAGLVAKDLVSNVDDAIVWPLYLLRGDGKCEDNVSARFLGDFAARVGRVDASGALAWIYAVLFAPWYRATFREALSSDYPRVPLPASRDAFVALSALGSRLLRVHLLRDAPRRVDVAFRGRAAAPIARARFAAGRVSLSEGDGAAFFDGVPEAAWDLQIGAYRPCAAWLHARRGKVLTRDDVRHFARVVAACAETASLVADIDRTLAELGGYREAFAGLL